MADIRKVLATKKAAALKQAADIDRDLQELERLAEKYGFDLTEREVAAASSEPKARKVRNADSPYYRGKMIAEGMVEAAGAPVGMAPIWEKMLQQKVAISGKNARSKFSAYLGKRSRLTYIKDRGWWFAGRPVPKKEDQSRAEEEARAVH